MINYVSSDSSTSSDSSSSSDSSVSIKCQEKKNDNAGKIKNKNIENLKIEDLYLVTKNEKKISDKTTCEKCNKLFSKSYIKRHTKLCKGTKN
jgi:hypothetical protein